MADPFKVKIVHDVLGDPLAEDTRHRLDARDANARLVGRVEFVFKRVEDAEGYDDFFADVNVQVHPDLQRRGIATQLLSEAERLFPYTLWEAPRVTRKGARFWKSYTGDDVRPTQSVPERGATAWAEGRRPGEFVAVGR